MSVCNQGSPNSNLSFFNSVYANNVDSVSFQPGFYDGDPNVELNVGIVKAETVRIGNNFNDVYINGVLYDSNGNIPPISQSINMLWSSSTFPVAPTSNLFVQKVGNCVTISLQNLATTSGGGSNAIIVGVTVLPVDYRPAAPKYFNVDVIQTNTVQRGTLKINTDGTMSLGIGFESAAGVLNAFTSVNGQTTGFMSCGFSYSTVY